MRYKRRKTRYSKRIMLIVYIICFAFICWIGLSIVDVDLHNYSRPDLILRCNIFKILF